MKKSFLLHHDSLGILEKLSDEQAGKLFKAIHQYAISGVITCDEITELVFHPFQMQFDRDNEKWDKSAERSRVNGSKGGRPKKENNPEKPSGLIDNPEKPVSVSVSVSDSVNVSVNGSVKTKTVKKVSVQSVVDLFNKTAHLPKVRTLSDARRKRIRSLGKLIPTIEAWETFFHQVSESDFLTGKNGGWSATFDWLLVEANAIKVAEGNYTNKVKPLDDMSWATEEYEK